MCDPCICHIAALIAELLARREAQVVLVKADRIELCNQGEWLTLEGVGRNYRPLINFFLLNAGLKSSREVLQAGTIRNESIPRPLAFHTEIESGHEMIFVGLAAE